MLKYTKEKKMKSSSKRKRFIIVVIIILLEIGITPIIHSESWPMFGHDIDHSRYSTSPAPDTNNIRWTYTTNGAVESSPAITDGNLYVGSADGMVYCLDAVTGDFVWEYATESYVDSSPAVAAGKVYVGSYDGMVYCLDAVTGDFVWEYATGDYVHSSPAVAAGKVYVGSNDYKIYCLDAMTGDFIWEYTTGSYVDSSPAVAAGNVYIGSDDKKMYCLDALTGDFIWSYITGGYVKSSPAIAHGNVYIGSDNKKVYCFGTPSSGGGGGGSEPPSNKNPVANASAGEPYHGIINTEIIFNGSQSYDLDGTIIHWLWDFGDLTNGTGEITNHTYTNAGIYTVTLTVTDNNGATNTDTTTCEITQPNRPPTPPVITGPINGTKNTLYNFSAISTDLDNDTISYTFNWGDLTTLSSELLLNGTRCTMTHSWAAAGRYHLNVTVTDRLAVSSANIIIYIDAVQTADIGYLLDYNSDGVYDAFYSDELNETLMIKKTDDYYLIDADGDGQWDYTFDTAYGIKEYHSSQTPGFEVILTIAAITLLFFLKRRRKNS